MKTTKGPQFVRFFHPILEVLREKGGSGTVPEVIDAVVGRMHIPEADQQVTLKNGQSRIRNQVQWARFYLTRAGYLDSSKRGVWSLTETGLSLDLLAFDSLKTFKEVHKVFVEEYQKKAKEEPFVDESDENEIETSDHKSSLLNLLKSLPAAGFERLCQRLLREAGFQQVTVTGKSGDGGIDVTCPPETGQFSE